MINQKQLPIFSNEIIYNGGAIGSVPLGSSPTLNDIFAHVGTYISTLTPTTVLASDALTTDVVVTNLGIGIGDTLSVLFTALDAYLGAIDFAPYLTKATYTANTILKADTSATPIALTVAEQTLIGRITGGNITGLTASQVITLLGTMNYDANSVFPYNTALPLSVGASTVVDKVLLVVKEGSIFDSNPYVSWLHNIWLAAGEGLNVFGKTGVKNYIQSYANVEDSGFIAKTNNTSKNAHVILTDGTNTWILEKDGTDSNKFKLKYYNGVTYATVLSIDKTTGAITFNRTAPMIGMLDEDSMASNSALHTISQQSFLEYFTANAAAVTEVNAIETGAGLNTDGTYTADATSNYLTAATSLKSSDSILDTQIKLINDLDVSLTQTAEKHVKCAYGAFNFSQHPTTGVYTINLATNIPDSSVITYARVDVTQSFADNGTNISTLGIGIKNISAGTEDVKTAAAIGTDFTIGLKGESWSTFKQASPFKLGSSSDITLNVLLGGAATALTAGQLSTYIEYYTTEK